MDRLTKGVIAGLAMGLICGAVLGYLLHDNIVRGFTRGRNFQINEETKTEIENFFASTSDTNEIKTYCENNQANCFYYCRSINPNHKFCEELTALQRPINSSRSIGARQWSR